jgi:hypothetical protein
MKLKLVTSLLLIVLFAAPSFGQFINPLEKPVYQEDMPTFAKMLYKDITQINFNEVNEAFEEWEKDHEKTEAAEKHDEGFEENPYEEFFKRWRRMALPYVQADGSIKMPTAEEDALHREQRIREQSSTLATRGASSTWTPLGPVETFWRNSYISAPWQANVYAIDIAPSNPNTLFCATETGGVFKTTNKGVNWSAVGLNYFTSSQKAVAIDPRDENTIYTSGGGTIHRSTNGGTAWSSALTAGGLYTNDIKINPNNGEVLVGGDNLRRYASSVWTTVLAKPIYDLAYKPTDPSVAYALVNNSAANLCEFWKSTDGGATWSVRPTGWISGLTDGGGRISVTTANADYIYVVLLTGSGPRVLKSTDSGETWTVVASGGTTELGMGNGQGYYDLSIVASTTNAEHVIVATTTAYKSTDGGVNYSTTGGYSGPFSIHPDIQEMVAFNGDTWIATDGGITYSSDFFTSNANVSDRTKGVTSVHFWGFDNGWNEDILVGGRYHNGNTARRESYPPGEFLRMGGAEWATGYVNPITNHCYFSDLGSFSLPTSINGTVTSINVTKYPNEDYASMNYSEQAWHPLNYNTYYLGHADSLVRTTDNGATFTKLYKAAGSVRSIEISRSNPNVMYFHETSGNIMKSLDGGVTWNPCTIPTTSNRSLAALSVSGTDPNVLWVAYRNAGNGQKVFKTIDGGATWTNLTTTALNGVAISDMVHQLGTDGGVYVIGDYGKAFYRNNSMTNWATFNTGLPLALNHEISRIKPFYKGQKLRLAANYGIWEVDFYENAPPLAQPIAKKLTTTCPRDSFYFDSYSAAKAGATWAWSFSPTPQYISDATARNPTVVFGAVGKYSATLTVTDANGTNTQTVTDMINITSDGNCDLSATIGKAMSNTATGDYLTTENIINLNKTDGSPNNEVTLMAWVKPNGTQPEYCSIVGTASGNAELIVRPGNGLGLSWNGATWDWSSGLTLTSGEWAHVALVVTPTNFKVYLNGKEAMNTTTVPVPIDLANNWIIGSDRGVTNRSFIGQIDEVCLYNRALSKEELREKMHLMKNPATDASLRGYFQFDETAGVVWNKPFATGALFSGNATRVTSTAPVAVGTSQRINITTGGIKDFSAQNLILEFPSRGIFPNGDIVVNELTASPDQNPTGGTPLSNKYWIINNYGTNGNFSPLTNIKFNNLTGATGAATNFKLYRRTTNADGTTWGTTIDGGDILTTNNPTTSNLTFTPPIPCMGITNFGQFALTDDATATPPLASAAECNLSTVIGKAMNSTTNGDYLITKTIDLNKDNGNPNNDVTIMAWIKPNGIQSSYAGLITCSTINANLNLRNNNELGFHWNDAASSYNWSTGLVAPANEWSHVALVTTASDVKMYLNGKFVATTYATPALNFAASQWYIGIDRGNSARTFKGLMDEVSLYNRALEAGEIRANMHLMKNPATDASLRGYYQFDETTGAVWNKSFVASSSSSFIGGAARTTSTAPVAVGTSQSMTITTGGVKDFSAQNLILEFPNTGTLPNGDVVVSELNAAPDQNPSGGTPLSNTMNKYWIVNNYGTNANFSPLTSIKFNNLTGFATGTVSNFKLYKRGIGADGTTWGTNIDGADAIVGSNLTFAPPALQCMGIANFGQFTITNDAAATPPSVTSAPCYPDTLPNKAASFNGGGSSDRIVSKNIIAIGANADFSISFWMKTNSATAAQRSILSTKDVSTTASNTNRKGFQFLMTSTHNVYFEVGDGTNGRRITSINALNDGQWHYYAGTVDEEGTMNFYVDGKAQATAQSMTGMGDLNNNTPLYMATDIIGDFGFTGLLDEVKVWDKTLTQDEVREKMHLTAYPQEPNLVAYYQFNNDPTALGTLEYDRKGINNLTFAASATRVASTAPVGGGTFFRLPVTTGGINSFTGTDCEIEFPASGSGITYPNGDIVVTKLNVTPDQLPTTGSITPLSNKYWIINNFGSNDNFSTLTSLKFSNLGTFASGATNGFNLYKRTNSEVAWGTPIDASDAISAANNYTMTFSANNNITSFSQFTIAKDNTVLPLDLLSFTATPVNNTSVELAWQTVNEKNVSHFEVERGIDGKIFTPLSKTLAKNGFSKNNYQTVDEQPLIGLSYYRLNMKDRDGLSTYSPIRSVSLDKSKQMTVKIYPNPASDKLNIEFQSDNSKAATFDMYNIHGQLVYSYKLDTHIGNNRLFVNTQQFPAGLYTLKIKQDNAETTKKIVIE